MKIEIRRGDITDQKDIDAIVNAANTELWLGSGVAGAIDARGGPQIECEAVLKGPVRLGEAVETTAGNLPNRFVIHAAAMGYRAEDGLVPKRAGTESSSEIIRDATMNSLKIADRLQCCSIAFPALATGVGRFPVDECAQVMITAARDYHQSHPQSRIEKTIFVLFTSGDFETFKRELEKIESH
ncbi:MAG: macro domain-containing protein [Acidobacteriota bacterium]